jgi:hypothetical protein
MNAWLDKEHVQEAKTKIMQGANRLFSKNDPKVPALQFYDLKIGSSEFKEKEEACMEGGGAGRAKFEANLYIEGGVEVSALAARARLGVEVTMVNVEARGSAELLKTGIGREVYLGSSSLSGVIRVYLQVIECKWHKAGWRWKLQCIWVTKKNYNIWGWNAPFDTGNLACRLKHRQNQCRDKGNDCCANEQHWGEAPKCAAGYTPRVDAGGHPKRQQDCSNQGCYRYGHPKVTYSSHRSPFRPTAFILLT